MNIRQWFCKHKWVRHSETILPSAFEQAARTGDIRTVKGDVPMWVFRKKFILTFMCEKCYKITQFVQSNPVEDSEIESLERIKK